MCEVRAQLHSFAREYVGGLLQEELTVLFHWRFSCVLVLLASSYASGTLWAWDRVNV